MGGVGFLVIALAAIVLVSTASVTPSCPEPGTCGRGPLFAPDFLAIILITPIIIFEGLGCAVGGFVGGWLGGVLAQRVASAPNQRGGTAEEQAP